MAYELFFDSFDTDTFSINNGTFSRRGWSFWFNISGTIAIAPGTGRRGTQGLRLTSNYSAYGSLGFTGSTHAVVGFWFNPANLSQGACQFAFRRGTVNHVTFRLETDWRVTFTSAGGVAHTSVNRLNQGDYVEFGIIVGDSGFVEMRVNGSSSGWFSLSGVDTKASSWTLTDTFFIEAGWSTIAMNLYIDDFYVTYGNELKWLGDVRVDALPLNANSTPQDWTPDSGVAYQRLTQAEGYIQSATVGDESLFELADYAVNTVAIHGVVVNARALKSDSGTRSFALEAKSGDTTSVGATNALGTTSQEFRQTWVADPDTGAAWTGAALNALKVGVKLVE